MRTLRGLEGVKIMVNLTTGDALVGRLARTGRDYLDLTSAELRSRLGQLIGFLAPSRQAAA